MLCVLGCQRWFICEIFSEKRDDHKYCWSVHFIYIQMKLPECLPCPPNTNCHSRLRTPLLLHPKLPSRMNNGTRFHHPIWQRIFLDITVCRALYHVPLDRRSESFHLFAWSLQCHQIWCSWCISEPKFQSQAPQYRYQCHQPASISHHEHNISLHRHCSGRRNVSELNRFWIAW